jgi:hypothetical protein
MRPDHRRSVLPNSVIEDFQEISAYEFNAIMDLKCLNDGDYS